MVTNPTLKSFSNPCFPPFYTVCFLPMLEGEGQTGTTILFKKYGRSFFKQTCLNLNSGTSAGISHSPYLCDTARDSPLCNPLGLNPPKIIYTSAQKFHQFHWLQQLSKSVENSTLKLKRHMISVFLNIDDNADEDDGNNTRIGWYVQINFIFFCLRTYTMFHHAPKWGCTD